jgi:hypothetical protein
MGFFPAERLGEFPLSFTGRRIYSNTRTVGESIKKTRDQPGFKILDYTLKERWPGLLSMFKVVAKEQGVMPRASS